MGNFREMRQVRGRSAGVGEGGRLAYVPTQRNFIRLTSDRIRGAGFVEVVSGGVYVSPESNNRASAAHPGKLAGSR